MPKEKKRILEIKKNFDHKKLFISFPSTFSNTQKESKNHIDRLENDTGEVLKSCKSK